MGLILTVIIIWAVIVTLSVSISWIANVVREIFDPPLKESREEMELDINRF